MIIKRSQAYPPARAILKRVYVVRRKAFTKNLKDNSYIRLSYDYDGMATFSVKILNDSL